MKAVVCQNGKFTVTQVPEPIPEKGHVVLNVRRCGICGSDLHSRHSCDHWGELMVKTGYRQFMHSREQVVFGHEFCGEVMEHGPGCKKALKPGARVVAMPVLRKGPEIDMLGFSGRSTGAPTQNALRLKNL